MLENLIEILIEIPLQQQQQQLLLLLKTHKYTQKQTTPMKYIYIYMA